MLGHIDKHKCSKIAFSFFIPILIVLFSGVSTSCMIPFKQFSSSDIDFTFEYPSDFNIDIQKHKDWPDSPNGIIEIILESSVSTIIMDRLDVTDDLTALSLYQSESDSLKLYEEKFKQIKNIEILKQDNIILDGVSGYDFVCKYDDILKSTSTGNNFRAYDRYIFVQRNEKLYALRFFVRDSQIDTIKVFQHLLDTWKWKQ
jgi:hypothetical protein